MTVKELKKRLESVDDNRIVVLSRDSEGNGYSEAYEAAEMNYNDWEVGFESLTPELEKAGYTEEDVIKGQPAFVIWP